LTNFLIFDFFNKNYKFNFKLTYIFKSIKSHSPIRVVAPNSLSAKIEVLENDDTDHDNDHDDELLDSLKLPPPVPLNAPPPLPKDKNLQDQQTSPTGSKKEAEIKKALYNNIKTVENWKVEQELLLKVEIS